MEREARGAARGMVRRRTGLAGATAVALLLSAAATASATPASQGGPVQLASEADLQFVGPSDGSAAGEAVDGAGDVNGDGVEDLIIGAQQAGEAYVVFGPVDQQTVELGDLGDGGFVISGAGPGLGASVSGAGDMDGDGYDDVIVSAWNGDGTSWVVYGGPDPGDVDVGSLGLAGFAMNGAPDAGADITAAVSDAGDVDCDGYDDVVVGATGGYNSGWPGLTGNAYVVFGDATRPTAIDFADLGDAGATIAGSVPNGMLGSWVSDAGDFDGDGSPDVIVGALEADMAYVVDGSALVPGAVIDAGALGADGTVIAGGADAYYVGVSVGGVDDFNGDGYDDVVISVTGSVAAVVFGGASPGQVDAADLGTRGVTLTNPSGGALGQAVAGAGDVNGDGLGDVLVGDTDTSFNGAHSGSVYLVFGDESPADVDLTSLLGAGFRMDGGQGSYTGLGLGGAGDLDSDGLDDVIVGADLQEIDGARPGAAYVVNGFGPQIALSPSGPLSFSALVGATQSQQVTISNGVATALNVSGMTVDGAGAGAFAVGDEVTCAGGTTTTGPAVVVPAFGQCTVEVTYGPPGAGTQSATLTIASDAAGDPAVSIPLTGTATLSQVPAGPPPEPAPQPEPLVPRTVPVPAGECRAAQATARDERPAWLRAGGLVCRVPAAMRGLADLSITRATTLKAAEGRARTLRRRGLVVRVLPAAGGYVVIAGERRGRDDHRRAERRPRR